MIPPWSRQGLLLFMVTLVIGLPTQRRLRVKTVENITAEAVNASPTTITTKTPLPKTNIQRIPAEIAEETSDEAEIVPQGPSEKIRKIDAITRKPTRPISHVEPASKSVSEVPTNSDPKGIRRARVKSDGTRNPENVDRRLKNTVISTSVVQTSNENASIAPAAEHTIIRKRNKLPDAKKRRGDNHIHVESNYTVTSVPTKGNNSESNTSWKNARIKENVRRKNILSRTSADPEGLGSESRLHVQKSRQRVSTSKVAETSDAELAKRNGTHTRERPLIRPPKSTSAATVYHFETGKLQRSNKSEDQTPSTSNEVPNEKLTAGDYHKLKNQNDEDSKTQPQKRYSSRYRGKKQYGRGNHLQSTEKSVQVDEDNRTPVYLQEEPTNQGEKEESDPPQNTSEEQEVRTERNNYAVEKEDTNTLEQKDPSAVETAEHKASEVEGNEKEGKEEKHSEGSEAEHQSDFHATKGEAHKKGYKGGHEQHNGSKGFHDKERHSGEYRDEKGSKKAHKEGGGHFEAAEHEEKGKKSADHAEKEQYKKGHSTRGGHVVHKLDEYEKKLEFFDESYDSGDGEKFGSHFESYGGKKGGHKKGGRKHSKSSGDHKKKKGKHVKGKHHHDDKGHDKKVGKVGHFAHSEKYGKEGGKKHTHKYNFSIDKDKKGNKARGGGEKGLYTEQRQGPRDDAVLDDNKLTGRVGNTQEDSINHDDETSTDEPLHANSKVETEGNPPVEEEGAEQVEEHEEISPGKETIKNVPKDAKYMNEDGPTSYFTRRAKEKTARLGDEEETENSPELVNVPHGGEVNVLHDGHDSISYLPDDIPRGNGYFMTEEEAIEDKEGEKAIEVFNNLHTSEHDEDRHQRSYKVKEEEEEPTKEESQTNSQRIPFDQQTAPIVTIVTKAILPPL